MKQIVKTDVLQCQKFMIVCLIIKNCLVKSGNTCNEADVSLVERTWTAWCGWEIGSKVGQSYNYVGVQNEDFINWV